MEGWDIANLLLAPGAPSAGNTSVDRKQHSECNVALRTGCPEMLCEAQDSVGRSAALGGQKGPARGDMQGLRPKV